MLLILWPDEYREVEMQSGGGHRHVVGWNEATLATQLCEEVGPVFGDGAIELHNPAPRHQCLDSSPPASGTSLGAGEAYANKQLCVDDRRDERYRRAFLTESLPQVGTRSLETNERTRVED